MNIPLAKIKYRKSSRMQNFLYIDVMPQAETSTTDLCDNCNARKPKRCMKSQTVYTRDLNIHELILSRGLIPTIFILYV